MEGRPLTPVEDALKHIAACRDKPFLEERYIDNFKGRGVFTNQTIEPSTFVVEYRGRILVKKANAKKKCGDCLTNYLFEFSWKGQVWCIDASDEDHALGRLVNDDHLHPNCELKKIVCNGKPHLCLFAVREICPDEEITYNYGNSFYFWRSKECYGEPSTSNTEFEDMTMKNECDELQAASGFDNSGFDDDNDKQGDWSPGSLDASSEMPQHGETPHAQGRLCSASDDSGDEDYAGDETRLNSRSTSYTAKNHCYVCGAAVSKISRHLRKHARDEPDIAAAFAKRKNSKERKRLLGVLRNRGNYRHNQEVLESNRGMLKIRRRSTAATLDAKQFTSCPYCKATHKRDNLWVHAAKCELRPVPGWAETPLAEPPLPGNVCKLLFSMRQDDVAAAIQKDFLLIKLAQHMLQVDRAPPLNQERVGRKLREVGKLLMALHARRLCSFEEAIRPGSFGRVVEAVRGLAGFDEETRRYGKPGLAARMGRWLRRICVVALVLANGKREAAAGTREFLELCTGEWDEPAPPAASGKANNSSTLQVTRDVQAFCTYLEKTSLLAAERLAAHGDPLDYAELCRVTLAQAFVLNDGVDQVAKMTLSGFQERDGTTRLLSGHFPGAAEQTRSVLLTPRLIEATGVLVSKREACGVHRDNPFVFARPDSSPISLFHGVTAVRALSGLCHAEKPEHLSSAGLRQHVARIFRILNLDSDGLSRLAKYLGRDIRTDGDYYRSPAATVDVAKIAKLVLAMEEGLLDRFEGKPLAEVEIDDELETDVVQVDSESGETEDDEESNISIKQKGVDEKPSVTRMTRRGDTERDALEHIRAGTDEPFLEQRFIDPDKGRGVFTRQRIKPLAFVVEYRGVLSQEDGNQMRRREFLDNYLFHFSYKGTSWCADASQDDGSLGRLANDNHVNPNCKIRKVFCDGEPHLCLFAVREISPGEEITYNYGHNSYPWRSAHQQGQSPQVGVGARTSSSEESCSDGDYIPDREPASDDSSSCHSRGKAAEDLTDGSDSSSDKGQRAHAPAARAQNYCLVCGEARTKMSRHLFTHRKEMPEIAEAFRLPKNSKTRHRLLEKLRKLGNFRRYEKTQKPNCRQAADLKSLAHCVYCKGFYMRAHMWRHMAQCSLKKATTGVLKKKVSRLILVTETIESNETSIELIQMLETLKKDKTLSAAASDPLLVQLARYAWHTSQAKSKPDSILQTARLIGRLLFKLRDDSVLSLDDAATPQNFGKLVEAVRELAGYDREKKTYARSGVVYKLFKTLEKIGDIKLARALQGNADKRTLGEAEAFLKLCADKWRSLTKLRVKSTATVPFVQDVQVLYRHMDNIITSGLESLTLYESPPVYEALLRVTAAQVWIFNKNTEVSQVTLSSFAEREEQESPGDAAADPEFQLGQLLPKHFIKFSIRQGGGQIPVVLTPRLLAATTLLVSKRGTCGISADNPFLFAKPDKSQRVMQGRTCATTCINRSDAKNKATLKAPPFHSHVLGIFQILSLGTEELAQLARQLGRDIPTDREHYQTPEAAADIAKIMELLSAMENGELGSFEGKAFEDVQFADELEPEAEVLETTKPEKDNEESDNASQTHDLDDNEDVPASTAKKKRKASSSRKGGGAKRQKWESEAEAPELNERTNDERDTWSEEVPEGCGVETPHNTPPRPHDSTRASFSDDEEDMNVDFDVDIDTDDDVRNDVGDGDRMSEAGGPIVVPSIAEESTGSSISREAVKETVNTVRENQENQKKGQKKGKAGWLAVEDMKSKVLPLLKEVKILIPRLNIDNAQTPVCISQVNSLENHLDLKENQNPTSGSTVQPSDSMDMQMICSFCKKILRKGQTAFQKKGFTDVFCSKNCLFQMFPTNKTVPKTCHLCQKAIPQPLDLIMAAVDVKGTMKDFCSIACLASFKSNAASKQPPQSDTREVALNEVGRKTCNNCSLENLYCDDARKCENCGRTCQIKPLVLLLEDESKTICSHACLEALKENLNKTQWCTTCHAPSLVSAMVHCKNKDNSVELFCTQGCVSSYTLLSPTKVKKNSFWLQRRMQVKEQRYSSQQMISESALSEAGEEPKVSLAESSLVCCLCEKEISTGQTVYQKESPQETFCSSTCLSEKHPHIKFVIKKCYNCFQVITRPHNIILAPVDESGNMMELCSDACLSSVNSRRNPAAHSHLLQTGCKTCSRKGTGKIRTTQDGSTFRFCSDSCFIRYHRVNNLPGVLCSMCCSVCSGNPLTLKDGDGIKTVCGDKCLAQFKERAGAPQPCLMCLTHHRMSDMVENTDADGTLQFFCSSRCMMVHNSLRPFPPQENKALNDLDIKEVKLPLNLDFIKKEPADEMDLHIDQTVLSTGFSGGIKEEPKVPKELSTKTEPESLFSLTEDSSNTPTTLGPACFPATCSNCTMALIDGESVYQRKGQADIFCSTSCLSKFYQLKRAMKTCHFCLQVILKPQDVHQGSVDDEETVNDFCSHSCLSSFNHKRMAPAGLPLTPATSQPLCSVCSRHCISKCEVTQNDVIHRMCSNPCFQRFCTINDLSVCDNCSSACSSPVHLRMDDGNKTLCSTECLTQFKRKMKTSQTCAMCSSSCSTSDMVESKTGDDSVELFCAPSCVTASKIQAVSASGIQLNCDNCGQSTLPACHLAMLDASIRNFCTLTCAMSFKDNPNAAANPPAAPERSHREFLKPPGTLFCAQCQCILDKQPKVIQTKDALHFVCSLACSEEFQKVNNMVGVCEYCKNIGIISDAKRVDKKDCCFCSEDCFMFFREELEKNWGDHCHSCTYCLSISKTLVTAPYSGTKMEFCSEACNSKYNRLFCHIARCDACSHEGKLGHSLPLLGEVKHFCDLKCLLYYCNQRAQEGDAGTSESSPIMANVISLTGALSRQSKPSDSSSHHVLIPDFQTKVVGHASVQTVPNELKNKSTLCTPLTHNKGVSCTTQTVERGVQTVKNFVISKKTPHLQDRQQAQSSSDKTVPKTTILPVPVPVYIPVPMNMYSQFVPTPAGLPLPLPVPVFLPVAPTGPDPYGWQGVQSSGQWESCTMKDRLEETVVAKGGQKADEASEAEITREAPPSAPEEEKAPRSSAHAASLQQPAEETHSESEGPNLQETPKPARGSHRGASEVRVRKHRKLNSQTGKEAWKRWIQWRESQTNLYLVSSPAVTLNPDVLQCSPPELSEGLVCFITEVKRADGRPYSPDRLFYLCLSIQQYLFDNGCMENIFSDHIYSKFSEVLTQTLRAFNPSCTASGYIQSRVEEDFLWDCKQLGAYSPTVLLNTLVFFCCKYFRFTTVEQHRQLSFAHLMRCTKTSQSSTKTTFLRFYPPICVTEFDGLSTKKHKSEGKEDILEMLENTENPLRCPVRFYEFYLSKCFKSASQRSDLFYLQPHGSCTPSSPVWYSSTPLDDSTLEAMLVRVLAVRELQGVNRSGADPQISSGEDSE